MTLRQVIIRAYCVIALLMTILVSGVYFLSQQQIESHYQRDLVSMIETIADSISLETQGLTQWVDAVAREEAMVEAFKAGEQQRRLKAQELEDQIPGLLRLRLLLPGVNQPDESQKPHLGYADLELMQTAKSTNPQPVIIQMGLPDAHIGIARAVYEDEQLVGTVLASFSTHRIKKFLQTLSKEAGEIALFQENQSLNKTDDSALLDSEPSGTITITGAPWEIRYWTAAKEYSDILYILAALLSTLLILGWLCMRILRKLNDQLANDVAEVKKLVTNTIKGVKENIYEFNFPIFSDLIQHCRLLNIRDVTGGKQSLEVAMTTEEEEEKKLAERSEELLRDLDKQFTQADNLIGNLDNENLDIGQKSVTKSDSYQSGEMKGLPDVVEFPKTLPLNSGITGIIDKDFNADYLRNFGRALGSEVLQAGMTKIVVGTDFSKSSQQAMQGMISGLLTTGCKLLDLKDSAGPIVAFSTQFPKESVGVYASNRYLPEQTCKLKILYGGSFISAELLERINSRIKSADYIEGLGVSAASDTNLETEYIGAVVEDIHIHCIMKVVILSASKTISGLAENLLKALGCDVINIGEPNLGDDSTSDQPFDPRNPSHLQQLSETVVTQQAELGIAFDTEGTGFSVIDSSGHMIWSDRVMMILVADVLQTYPGADILFDSDCLSTLAKTITQYSGKLLTHSSGEDAFSQLATTNMPLAGNMNGQFVFADRWLQYPDALYASARLLEILSSDDHSSQEVFSALPDYIGAQPLIGAIAEKDAHQLLDKWEKKLKRTPDVSVSTDNGLRIDATNIGWVIVRYEKEQGGLAFRFQAKSDQALQKLMKSFNKLAPNNADFKLPF